MEQIKEYPERKKKKTIKIIMVLIMMLILAVLITMLCSIDIKAILYHNYLSLKAEQQIINNNEMECIGYQKQNNVYIADQNDPQLQIIEDNQVISDIEIQFSEELKNTLNIQIYYSVNNEGYNEENSVKKTVLAGEKDANIEIYKKNVTSLRLDIGESIGDTFALDSITLNGPASKETIQQQFKDEIAEISYGRFFHKWELMALVLCFLGLHFCVNIKLMYKQLFKKRWLVALFLLLFLVANKFHGESIAVYDNVIQTGNGSEYVQPILGKARLIRSDDFVVETPNKMASIQDGRYGKYNEIARGTKTLNSINGVYVGYSTLGRNPFQYAYKILPAEYAYSFCWYGPVVLCFMLAIELFYIISGGNALIAVTGASLEIFSSFYLWWGFPSMLLGAQGALVCAYYFIQTNKRYKQILLGLGVAILFANYVLYLYPAWIVPMGFVALCCLIWMIHENWEKIKKWKWVDWGIIVLVAIFSISLLVTYLFQNREYIYAITHTLYPGKRVENGGFALDKLFYYGQSYLYAFKDIINPAEGSVIFCLFPIPMILAAYDLEKQKKKNWLTAGLLIISAVFLVYVTVGLPGVVAKVLLLSFSTSKRLIDILGIIQVYFIVIVLSNHNKGEQLPTYMKYVLGVGTALVSLFYCKRSYPEYLSTKCLVISFILIVGFAILLSTKHDEKRYKIFCILICIFSVITSISIRPISCGFDAITSKSVSKEISKIAKQDPKGKWLTYDTTFYAPGFLIASGASTINSTNTYPNLELWEKLDENKEYEEIYNRYSHIGVEFTDEDTSFELVMGQDQIKLNLSYKDISKTDVKYVFALQKLEINNEYITLENLYDEDGAYIYKVNYK